MTSALGLAVSNWLQRVPGCYEADTEDDVYAFAYEEFPQREKFSLQDFRDGLNRAGYRARTRSIFAENGSVIGEYWQLPLPERHGGF